jgi:hypothetical protein
MVLDTEDYIVSLEDANKDLGSINIDLEDRLTKSYTAIRWILGDFVAQAIEDQAGVVVDQADGESVFRQAFMSDRDSCPMPPHIADVIDGAFGIDRTGDNG